MQPQDDAEQSASPAADPAFPSHSSAHQTATSFDNNSMTQEPRQQPTDLTIATASSMDVLRETEDDRIVSPPSSGEPQIHYYGLALVFLAPALGGFLYGYDIGATSFVLSMMKNDRDHDHWWHHFSKVQQGLFVSCLALGALIGSHIVLVFLAQSIGRRKEIRIAATLYILGTMLNVMSGTILATTGVNQYGFGWGLTSLLTGRLLYGAGVGFIMHSAPAYMAEMYVAKVSLVRQFGQLALFLLRSDHPFFCCTRRSPSQVRGALVSAKETVIVFGIIIGMLLGDFQSDYPDNWHELYGYSVFFAVPMLLLTFKIPRSKRWLLMKGYHEEAKESMQFVYKGNVEHEFEKMAETINSLCCRNISDNTSNTDSESVCGTSSKNGAHEGGVDDDASEENDTSRSLCSWRYRHVILIGMGLLVSQQFSGQPCVLAYSRVLFEAAGWNGNTSVITVTIMGIVSMFTVSMVDRLGRKALLAAGSSIMLVAVSALAYGFWGWDDDSDDKLSATKMKVVLVSMFVFISGYQVGFGPVTWTVLSEIYPTEIRGTAMALSVEVNFFSKFLTQFLFPIVQDVLGWGTTFVVFGSVILAGLIFILVKVPETKGMTLEDIQLQLKGVPVQRRNNSKDLPEFQYENMDSFDKDAKKPLASTLLKQSRLEKSTELPPIV
jgi:MFS family permease